jgi:predicted nucleic acid-binding protein
LSGIVLPGKRIYRRVFALYTSVPLGFADCYHLALMERLKLTEVISFDTDFDGLSSVTRREV